MNDRNVDNKFEGDFWIVNIPFLFMHSNWIDKMFRHEHKFVCEEAEMDKSIFKYFCHHIKLDGSKKKSNNISDFHNFGELDE